MPIAPRLLPLLALLAALATLGRGRRANPAVGLLRGAEVVASVMPHFWLGAVLIAVWSAVFTAPSPVMSPAQWWRDRP